MNIDEYRALKAQIEQEQKEVKPIEDVSQNAQVEQTPNGEVSETGEKVDEVSTNPQEETKPTENSKTKGTSQEQPPFNPNEIKVEIDGQELTLEELKNGYLRQSDYTRKTQEIKRKEREAEEAMRIINELKQNPQIAKVLAEQFNAPQLDPEKAKVYELEQKYYDLLIEKEINELSNKYSDFDAREVVEFAMKNNINNLEIAYHAVQSQKGGGGKAKSQETVQVEPSLDELKEQIRQEILEEIKKEQERNVDTTTIIDTRGSQTPIEDNKPKLSRKEIEIATKMGISPEEYAKWRNFKKGK